jgi:hypothetical protein
MQSPDRSTLPEYLPPLRQEFCPNVRLHRLSAQPRSSLSDMGSIARGDRASGLSA